MATLNMKWQRDWPWTHSSYVLQVPYDRSAIQSVAIDATYKLADANVDNNRFGETQP